MTTITGAPSFQDWQLAHALTHDPDRHRRLVQRWRAIAAELLRRAVAAAYKALADRLRAFAKAMFEILRPVVQAAAAAVNTLAGQLRAAGLIDAS